MKLEEIINDIRQGREFRRPYMNMWLDNSVMAFEPMEILAEDWELRPLAPVFEHWHMLPGWAREWVAQSKEGSWYSTPTEPELSTDEFWEGDGTCCLIPEEYWPQWTGDWRESKIQRPADLGGVWVTRESLAKAWNARVFNLGVIGSADTLQFENFAREVGVMK